MLRGQTWGRRAGVRGESTGSWSGRDWAAGSRWWGGGSGSLRSSVGCCRWWSPSCYWGSRCCPPSAALQRHTGRKRGREWEMIRFQVHQTTQLSGWNVHMHSLSSGTHSDANSDRNKVLILRAAIKPKYLLWKKGTFLSSIICCIKYLSWTLCQIFFWKN